MSAIKSLCRAVGFKSVIPVLFVCLVKPVFAQQTFSLTIEPTPADARIRIMNINPRYEDGITLAAGEYDIEISREGYFTYREWIELTRDTVLDIALELVTENTIRAREKKALETGTPVYTFKNNSRDINRVVFSSSGRYAVAAGYRVIRLWDIRSGTNLVNFRGHSGTVECVAISPDERYVASGGYDETLRLWNAATGEQIGILDTPHSGYVESVAFSPDGRYLASAGMDNQIKLWDVYSGQLLRTFEGHVDWVLSIRFSSDGAYLISGSADQSIKLWEVATGGLSRSFYGFRSSYEGAGELIDISPDGTSIIGVSTDNAFVQWDIDTGEILRTFYGHRDHVTSVKFSSDDRYIASSGADRLVKIWDRAGREVASFSGHQDGEVCDWVNSIDISPDNRYIVSGGCDDMLHIWLVPKL